MKPLSPHYQANLYDLCAAVRGPDFNSFIPLSDSHLLNFSMYLKETFTARIRSILFENTECFASLGSYNSYVFTEQDFQKLQRNVSIFCDYQKKYQSNKNTKKLT